MAEEAKSGGFKAVVISVVSAIAIALVVGGNQPYWFKYFKKEPAPVSITQATSTSDPVAAKGRLDFPVASREFLLGRWHAEVSLGNSGSRANTIDFFPNGRFDGERSGTDTLGSQIHVSGLWTFQRISDSMFVVSFHMDRGIPITPTAWSIKYKIIDQDHMENLDGGFMVDRLN